MLSPKLYKNSHAYDLFMRVFGFEASVERFLRTCDIPRIEGEKILDNGCGSGTIGIHFLQAASGATLLSTDLEPNFLDAAIKKAKRRGLPKESMEAGIANISDPTDVTALNGQKIHLEPGTFQLICIGAVLGYSDSPEDSLRTLIKLLRPGGHLLNLEMKETMLGKYVSKRYHYQNISMSKMQDIMLDEQCVVTQKPMHINHFPACMTRTALIARKTRPHKEA